MRIATILLLLGAMMLAGCGEHRTYVPRRPITEPPAADNTGINRRDAGEANLTPLDQKENPRDLQITADIRQRLLAAPDLSINAQNAKVITAGGKVTLRGPVASEDEKDLLGRIALSIAGDGNVTNLLEVTP